ncbi:MAG: amidohydrolase family protein [Anaerolineae bacterium]
MIVDANAYVGRWPFRRLGLSGAAGLKTLLQRTATDVALASPIAGAFYRDCLTAVEEMLEDDGWDAALMRPVAVVDPTYPGWEADLDTMVARLGCVAVRVLPNYHSYTLHDDCALALAGRVQELRLPLIITMRMQDERSHHRRMSVPAVTADEVRFLLRVMPHGRYVLSNVTWSEVSGLRPEMEMADDAVWEMSYKPPPYYVEKAVHDFGAERVLYGSGAPLQYPEAALTVVQQAQIGDAERAAILAGNAARVFGLGG